MTSHPDAASRGSRRAITVGIVCALFVAVPEVKGAAPDPPPQPDETQAPRPRAPIDLVWMAGPVANARPEGSQPANTAALRQQGARLYERNCAACHGTRGDGRGPQADTLRMPPANFTVAVYKMRTTPSGTLPTDLDIFETITRGLHGTEMFPWTRLQPDDRWALVYRLKTFSSRFRDELPGTTLVVGEPPPETEARRERGAQLYDLLRCNACHGGEGAADGPAVDAYGRGADARRVRIRDFRKGQFLRGGDMSDIMMTLRTGLDGTPMGAYESLAADDLWALAAHVRTLVLQHRAPAIAPPW